MNISFCLLQLQHLAGDEGCLQVTKLLLDERKQGATGGSVETAHQRLTAETSYQHKAEQLLADENCFKIAIVSCVVVSVLCCQVSVHVSLTNKQCLIRLHVNIDGEFNVIKGLGLFGIFMLHIL